MIDFDHSISNSSSHESNNLNSDFIGSKRSEDSEEIFKDDEFEDSEAKKSDDEDGKKTLHNSFNKAQSLNIAGIDNEFAAGNRNFQFDFGFSSSPSNS